MTIRADKREWRPIPDPDGLALVARAASRLLDVELELARYLVRVWRKAAYAAEVCASLEELGRRHGLAPERTRMLLFTALGMELDPRIEDQLRSAAITIDAAGQIGQVLSKLGGADPKHDWVEKARTSSSKDLRRAVSRRLAEIRQRTVGLETLTFHVTERVTRMFERARLIASRKRATPLSHEQTFETVTDHYLDAFDPERSGEGGGRRLTTATPSGRGGGSRSRSVPNEVKAKLRTMYGDACCVPGCEHQIFVDRAHKQAYEHGGDQELENLMPLCTRHHLLFDAGRLWLRGHTGDGRPIFVTRSGRVLHPGRPVGERKPPDAPPPDQPPSPWPDVVRDRGPPPGQRAIATSVDPARGA